MRRTRYIIREDVTKGEVNGIVKDQIEAALKSRDFKKRVREITADVLDDFFKNLYTRKSLWKQSLQNG